MAYRLTHTGRGIASAFIATLLPIAAVVIIGEEFRRPLSYLVFGLLWAYIFSSSYLCLRMTKGLDGRRASGKTVAVLVSAALALAMSWVIFGAYFYITARLGFESVEHLKIDLALKLMLHLQIALLSLLCGFLAPQRNRSDLVVSLFLWALITLLVVL